MTLYYGRASYDLTLNNYGVEDTRSVKYEASIAGYGGEPGRPADVSENAEFKGWYTVEPKLVTDDLEPFSFEGQTMPAKNLVLYAYWAEPDLTITVTVPSVLGENRTLTIPKGSSIAESDEYMQLLSDVATAGYEIDCWLNADGTVYDVHQKLYDDTTLGFRLKGETYTVTYNMGDITAEEPVDSRAYELNAKAAALNPAAPSGKEFLYWTDASGQQYYAGDSITMTADVTLTAHWRDVAETTTLTYKVGENAYTVSGITLNSKETLLGATDSNIKELLDPVVQADGNKRVFVGWSTDENATSPTHSVGGTYRVNNENPQENVLYPVFVTVTKPNDVTYNGLDQKLKPQFSSEVTGNYTLDYGSSNTKDAGTVTMTLTATDPSLYGTVKGLSYEINRRSVTITVDSKTKVYGADDPALTGTVGDLVAEDDLGDVAYGRAEGDADKEDVGDDITLTASYRENPNYNVSVNTGKLTITAQSVNPEDPDYVGIQVAGPRDTVYNGSEQKLLPTVTDKNGKTLLLDSEYTVAWSENTTNVGTVTITVTGQGNYTGSTTVTYRITPATAIVSANAATKAYGTPDSDVTLGATVTGLIGSDAVKYAVAIAEGHAETPGVYYDAVVASGTEDQGNYTVKYQPANLTITQQSITPTDPGTGEEDPRYTGAEVQAPADVTYNGQSQQEKPVVTDGQGNVLVEGTDYDLTYSDDTVNVGTVEVTVTAKGNYTGSVTVSYQIKAAEVTVTADDQTKEYGADDPQLTAKITDGQVFGDDQLDYTLSREAGEELGEYAITATPGTNGNYNVTYLPGTLTVTQQTLDPSNPTDPVDPTDPDGAKKGYGVSQPSDVTYNGSEQRQAVQVFNKAGEQLVEGTDYTVEYSAATNTGTVTVTVTGTGNYTGTVERTYRILPAQVTVTANDAVKVYGAEDPAFSATVEGLVNGESASLINYGLEREAGEATGTYAINASGAAEQGNYTVSFAAGTLTITAQSIDPTDPVDPDPDNPDQPVYSGVTVTAPGNVTYNGTAQTPAPTVVDRNGNPLAEGTDYELVYSNNTDAGAATVAVRGIGNYAGEFQTGFQIAQAPLTITTGSATKVFDGTPLTSGTVTSDGFVNGEGSLLTITATGMRQTVGTSENTATVNDPDNVLRNYAVTWVLGALTVTPVAAPVPPTTPPTPAAPTTPTVTPAAPAAAPAAPAPAPAAPAATETIADDATPQAAEPETIGEDATPLMNLIEQECWVHWVMFVGIVATVVSGAVLVGRRQRLASQLKSVESDFVDGRDVVDMDADTVTETQHV